MDKVAQSIDKFGFRVPVVIDKDNVIVCGHTRYKAAQKLHLASVPCVVADDLTDEQIKAYRLADNKVSEDSEWDMDLLHGELADIIDIDMTDFGFDVPNLEEEPEEPEYYGAERERTFESYNLYDVDSGRLTDYWQMAVLKKCKHIPTDMISFNYAKTSKEFEKVFIFTLTITSLSGYGMPHMITWTFLSNSTVYLHLTSLCIPRCHCRCRYGTCTAVS